jgi:hypothetical protein
MGNGGKWDSAAAMAKRIRLGIACTHIFLRLSRWVHNRLWTRLSISRLEDKVDLVILACNISIKRKFFLHAGNNLSGTKADRDK